MKKYMGEDEVIKLNEALAKGRTYTVAEIGFAAGDDHDSSF